jgi:hypothetical protein
MLRKVNNTVMSHEQNATPNHNIKTDKGDESIESVVGRFHPFIDHKGL